MLNHYSRLFLVGLIFIGLGLSIPKVQAEELGMVTGSDTGTYIQFGHDIAKVVRSTGIDIIVKESEGSLDNIRRIRSKENAAIAIVQSDLLGFLKRSNDPIMQDYSKSIKLVFPFYNEEVHLLATKEIKHIQDLNGKRVVVGTDGSGNYLTSNNLLHMFKIKPSQRITNLSPLEAVGAVLLGKADAMFYVTGKPVTLFQNIIKIMKANDPAYAKLVENIHFVPLDDEKMRQEYTSSTIGPQDYKWVKKTVPTIAVKAALISFDFSTQDSAYYQKRCRQLADIGQAVRQSLGELKQTGHSKWKEVDLDEETGIWEWDSCSRMQSQQDNGETKTKEAFEQKILDFLRKEE